MCSISIFIFYNMNRRSNILNIVEAVSGEFTSLHEEKLID